MSAAVEDGDIWSSDGDSDDADGYMTMNREEFHDFDEKTVNFDTKISETRQNSNDGNIRSVVGMTDEKGRGKSVGKVVRVAGGRTMQTNPQFVGTKATNQESMENFEHSHTRSDANSGKSKQTAKKDIVEINSIEEASFVICNLRKLRSTNDRQVNSSTATIQSIDAFDRLVVSSNKELQFIVSKGKRMDEKISQAIVSSASSSSSSSLLSPSSNHYGDCKSPSSMQSGGGTRNNEEDFKAALSQRVYDSPIKNSSPSGAKYTPDPITFNSNNDHGTIMMIGNTGKTTTYVNTSNGVINGQRNNNDDDDEWSDDEEEKDAERLRKYNLPPSPSKNDFYDDYDMYDNSNYGSDDEKNVQVEKITTTFSMDTKNIRKKNKNVGNSNNNSLHKESSDRSRNKAGPPTVNTFMDEIELTYGDDDNEYDDLGSELVFKSSGPSKMPKPAQKLNDARAAAVMSSNIQKSKSLSCNKKTSGNLDSSTANRKQKMTMPANLLGTKGGVIRVRAPGRVKTTK